MKKKILCSAVTALSIFLFCACGDKENTTPIDTTTYTESSIVISSFTEIAGEKADDTKETENRITYIYEIKDPRVGAATYNLYKDYLDANFTYSSIESTAVGDGFCAVYHAANDARIEYTETLDSHSKEYRITVSVPK